MQTLQTNFIENVSQQFRYYKSLGDKTIAQLSETDCFWQYNEESNSIAIIVNHIAGNMLSRWTNFLTEDGEKEWRNREQEFQDVIKTKELLLTRWEEGWQCLFAAINLLDEENFDTKIYIRKIEHTSIEAINRQLAHYAYHVGQMVFIGKMIRGSEWLSLSIPKGQSQAYNDKKFAQGIDKSHYTAEFLNDNPSDHK